MRLEAGDAVRTLGPGEVALVPRGEGHVLRSEPGVAAPGILDLPRELVSERYEILRLDGDGPPTTLLCGAVRFGHPAAASFVGVLPEIIHLVRHRPAAGDAVAHGRGGARARAWAARRSSPGSRTSS